MLYDPKWEVQTKADPFSLESLIAWLEKMPARKVYCYMDLGNCLFGQYYRAQGYKSVQVSGSGVTLNGTYLQMPEDFSDIPVAEPRTFGAALTRAREALASRA